MAAFYCATIKEFLQSDTDSILGQLSLQSRNSVSSILLTTTISFERTVAVLKSVLPQVLKALPGARDWGILLEYEIPRRDRRIDCVLLAGSIILVLEFKTGEADLQQPRKGRSNSMLSIFGIFTAKAVGF